MKRTQKEIDRVLNWAMEADDHGRSKFPGMSYEQGVISALHWMIGLIDEAPDED